MFWNELRQEILALKLISIEIQTNVHQKGNNNNGKINYLVPFNFNLSISPSRIFWDLFNLFLHCLEFVLYSYLHCIFFLVCVSPLFSKKNVFLRHVKISYDWILSGHFCNYSKMYFRGTWKGRIFYLGM